MAEKLSKQQKGGLATAKAADAAALRLYPSMRWAFQKGLGNYSEAADLLNVLNIPTPAGKRWYPASVQRTIKRIEHLKGKPLIHPDKLDDLRAYAEVYGEAIRRSEDGRRLRSEKQLAADRKVRRKKIRKAQREWRAQHGERLRERLLALYQTVKPLRASTVAGALNQESFPVPPGYKVWYWNAVLKEGRKVGAPWPRKYSDAEWREFYAGVPGRISRDRPGWRWD